MAKTKIKYDATGYCCDCKREYVISDFYESKASFLGNGHINYCSTCCEQILKHFVKEIGTLEGAMWFTCAKLDIPFIKRVYDATINYKEKLQYKSEKEDNDYKLFSFYMMFLWGSKSIQKVTDTWNDFSDSDVDYKEIQGVKIADENVKQQKEELELNWGDQETEEDYKFLEYQYKKYTRDVEFENPQQEDLYRDLCLARLEKRKVEAKRIDGDLSKIQGRIVSLLKLLKLDNFEDTKPKTASEMLISAKIAQIEEFEPADFYKDKEMYKDVSGLRKYEQDMVLRPLGNTLLGHRDFNISMEDIQQYNLKCEEGE